MKENMRENMGEACAEGVSMTLETSKSQPFERIPQTGETPEGSLFDLAGLGFGGKDVQTQKKTVLLHSCCGPCSTACIERLLTDYKVTIFFYNPNITDRDEYEKRKANQIKFIDAYNEHLPEEDKVSFIEGEYLPEDFFEVCSGYSNEPEGGKRCEKCFWLRLERTAAAALKTGNELFGTTLTVSPHKNYPLISAIGCELATKYGLEFLDIDFKKKAGFQRSIELSKEYGLYRQNYCGCEYSKWDGYDKPREERNK